MPNSSRLESSTGFPKQAAVGSMPQLAAETIIVGTPE
jgi:hypothetical protein